MPYTSICCTKATRELLRRLAESEHRTQSQIVGLALEARYQARAKAIAGAKKTNEASSDV